MSTEEKPDARSRFVEAMKEIISGHPLAGNAHGPAACYKCEAFGFAVDAFADTSCIYYNPPHAHDVCRAALRKECGL